MNKPNIEMTEKEVIDLLKILKGVSTMLQNKITKQD